MKAILITSLCVWFFSLKEAISFTAWCEQKDITNSLHISANKLDRIMDSAILIKKDGLKYSVMDKKVKNYIYLSEEELDTYLQWDENEIAVYLCLKFRCGDDDCIQTSRESIEKGVLMTHTVVTRTVQLLESRKLISVERKENYI